MDNTMKLLRTFIEVSGFEVEEHLTNPECHINKWEYDYKLTKREPQAKHAQFIDGCLVPYPEQKELLIGTDNITNMLGNCNG